MTASFPPTLLQHGVDDSVVPVEESRYTTEQLQKLGVPVIYREVTGAEHGYIQHLPEGVKWPVPPAVIPEYAELEKERWAFTLRHLGLAP